MQETHYTQPSGDAYLAALLFFECQDAAFVLCSWPLSNYPSLRLAPYINRAIYIIWAVSSYFRVCFLP